MFRSRGLLLHLSTMSSLWGGGRVVVRAVAKIVVAVTGIVIITIALATAQNWPTRPLTIVYPFAAGSAGDALGRIFATRLSELLKQPVIFENVGGAGGMIGASRVARAAPDGYQILLGTTSTLAVNQTFYKNPLYSAINDFAPVVLIAESPIVLVARKDLPANNLQEFIAHARVNQAKMQYGSAGVGSSVPVAAMSVPATEERLKGLGSILVAPERPEYLQKFIQSEIEKWAAVIKAASIKD